jgi:hypothetical protein
VLRPYGEAVALDLAGGLDTRLDDRRRLAQALVGELLELDAGHLDVDVDAVEQEAGGCGRSKLRFWYLVTMPGEQVQGFSGSP